MEKSTEVVPQKFIWRTFVVPLVLFILIYAIGNTTVNVVCSTVVEFDCPVAWPISIFSLRAIEPYQILLALVLLIGFPMAVYWLNKWDFPRLLVISSSVLLILATSSLAGWFVGFVTPISDGTELYYYDAVKIDDPFEFVRTYEEAQPTTLLKHTRTNPPGATLTVYVLNSLLQDIGLISVAIVIIAGSFSSFFMWGLVYHEYGDKRLAGYAALLFMVLPAIQIYYTDATDPIISTSLLGVLYFLRHPNIRVGIIGAIVSLFVASFTTFLFVFILPILGGYWLFNRYEWRKLAAIFTGVVILYLLVYLLFGFNYINSFRVAAYIENYVEQSAGLNTYSDSLNYVATRIEGIAEILFFFTPFMLVRLFGGVRQGIKERPVWLVFSGFAALSLLGMLGVGIWRTAETARLAIFIYPYLFLPVVAILHRHETANWQRLTLISAVFVQTVLMQLIGIYFA